jgi:hypothetical protein
MKATARKAGMATAETARPVRRETIVAEFYHAMDAWTSNSLRFVAEGLALEKYACDTGAPVPSRLICIRAALRTWRELNSLQSEVVRLAMLFAAGRSPFPDDTAEDIKAVKAAGHHVLKVLPKKQEDLRQWIAEGETLEADLEALTNSADGQDNHSESITAGYNKPAMDTATAYAIVARDLGKSVEDLQKLRTDDAARATTSRSATATPQAPAPVAQEWPSEKWETSPEKAFRKQHAIVAYLRRVWTPFIENTGAVVTVAMLTKIDEKGGLALSQYLKNHDMPSDIPIVKTKELSGGLAERPTVFRQHTRDNGISANR